MQPYSPGVARDEYASRAGNRTRNYSVTNLNFEANCKTDIGRVRSRNEDVCYTDKQIHCYLVADGMGGEAGGDIAASIFRQATDEIFAGKTPQTEEEAGDRLNSCFQLAHKKIHQYVIDKPEFIGMGCTADLLTFHEDRWIIGHVGDSRTYIFRDGELTQLTKDHFLLHEQCDPEAATGNEAGNSRFRNVLIQAVGVDMQIDVDITTGPAVPDSQFIICSDGLYTMVTEEEIAAVLAFDAPLALKTKMLINMANDNGGNDNIAVALVRLSK